MTTTITPPSADFAAAPERRIRRKRISSVASVAVIVIAFVASTIHLDVSAGQVLAAMPAFGRFIAENMWPPDFKGLSDLLLATLVTIEVAFLGTLLAAVVSLPLALLGARNLAPHRSVFVVVRFLIMVCRAVPDFVFALMFVAALGLGPLPGILGLAIHSIGMLGNSIGMLGKVYAERIEEVDPGPGEALAAVGASPLQIVKHAVLPQIMPSLVANTLYRFDINIRSSIVLGIVGAGGIGYELVTALQALDYRRAAAVMIIVLVLVAIVEAVSNRIRRSYM
ncbi:Phosphate-import permease protein PhnE [Nocardia cerradoensis]|uniref:Phosphate-import permease protein PhnE n=1 Tax=Nocardia cerradoensis TaxID=85688 RepID=A0A231GZP6_9NOCA|nr:phosphonate ABC transporter, permease protein PhnE [Nocardia cerradoensis]OXR42070.1 Phosphate-import permease protein PhnE [Nocardia cerradoensis]